MKINVKMSMQFMTIPKIDFILEEFLGMFKPDSKKETTQN